VRPVALDPVSAFDELTPRRPRWHLLDPANASTVVAWLASEESGYLSGAALRVVRSSVMRMDP
jgi:hypothetical protein